MSHKSLSRTFLVLALALSSQVDASGANAPWVGTWAVSPQKMNPVNYGGKTLREVVHTSAAGTSVRAHFSNLFGDTPLSISNVHVALRAEGSSTQPSTDAQLTFHGQPTLTLAPGEVVTSDPSPFSVPAVSDVMVSFYVPGATNVTTGHSFSNQSKYVASGDVAGATSIEAYEDGDYYFLTNLDVQGDKLRGAVVAFGASGTDGYQSSQNANKRWPNDLAVRATAENLGLGILNQGISGNNLFNDGVGDQSAIKRFDRDALSQPGVRWVIFSDAPLNDFINSVPEATAPNVIAAYQGLIALAHSRDVKFMCSTLTPFEGYRLWTPEGEARRQAVNVFIRSADSGCDAVVDLESAIEDPAQPSHVLPAFDSGDHLHPNDAGYQAIADAVNLALFPPADLGPVTSPAGCGNLNGGESLTVGQALLSCDGRFSLMLGEDGDVSVSMGSTRLVATNTAGSDGALLTLGNDGNLLLRGALGEPLWQSNSTGHPGARLFMQNDGNVVIYSLDEAVWNSGSQGH